jgi:hypothetical protein
MSLTLTAPVQKTVTVKKFPSLTLAGIPLYVYAVSMAALFIIIGLIWDISWHMTIGRDKLLSPPHLLIYLGAVFGGLFSGIQVLWNSFAAGRETKKKLVKIWGIFYSSLGALFCIWGAIAMLTSAPFDDWWHNTYGLDIVILSPPHTLLALGMLFLMFGSCVSISKYMNGLYAPGISTLLYKRQIIIYRILFIISASCLLCMACTLLTEYLDSRNQHHSTFYKVATAVFLLFLPAFSKALRMKWGMTAIAIGYFLILGSCNWVLQQFPAEAKLGPILNPVTYFQSLQFPILFFIPAIVLDIMMQKLPYNDWIRAAMLSCAFVLLLFAVQFPFSSFLLESPLARNKFFGSESWYYAADPDWEYRYKFASWEIQSAGAMVTGLAIAVLIGFAFARLSLRWGKWFTSVSR